MISIKVFIVIFFGVIFIFFSQSIFAKSIDRIHPKEKYTEWKNSYTHMSQKVKISSSSQFSEKYNATLLSVTDTFLRYGSPAENPTQILLLPISNLTTMENEYKNVLSKPGSYYIQVEKQTITIKAKNDVGLLHGLSTVEALVDENKGELHLGKVLDYPDLNMRILHISMWPCILEDFKETIRLARLEHYNTLIWLNHFGVKLKSLKHLKANNRNRWSIEQFKEMVSFVKQNGLEIIPELKLLSHQKKFMGTFYPQYMYNKATYDPRKHELYTNIVFPAIDELVLLTGAKRFHIGHDEVAGWSEWFYRKKILNENDRQLPAKLFLKDILILHDYLKSKNIETWMWSDMLYTKKEFPSMKKAGANLNGMNGFDKIRQKIPTDIVMNAWHYRGKQKEFPTAKLLIDSEYKVLGATWKSENTMINYSQYMYKQSKLSKNSRGMIATTWYGLSGKRKSELQNIIKFSGEAFWNAK